MGFYFFPRCRAKKNDTKLFAFLQINRVGTKLAKDFKFSHTQQCSLVQLANISHMLKVLCEATGQLSVSKPSQWTLFAGHQLLLNLIRLTATTPPPPAVTHTHAHTHGDEEKWEISMCDWQEPRPSGANLSQGSVSLAPSLWSTLKQSHLPLNLSVWDYLNRREQALLVPVNSWREDALDTCPQILSNYRILGPDGDMSQEGNIGGNVTSG